jgi:hypothetical protein
MAYSFGGGVRPELGRTDYSGYLQGALTGAQGVAAGGSAIGRGIANLGAGIGEGLNKYSELKKQDKELSASNKAHFTTIEDLANSKITDTKQKLHLDSVLMKAMTLESPRERNVYLTTVLKGFSDTLNLGIQVQDANLRRQESELRTNGAGAISGAVSAYNGEPPPTPPAISAASSGVPNQTPESQGTPQTPTDPFDSLNRGLKAAGNNILAIEAVNKLHKSRLGNLVEQASGYILEDISLGGTGENIPAGVHPSVYIIAAQTPEVLRATETAKTDVRRNNIASAVGELGSNNPGEYFNNLGTADRLEALKTAREIYPKSDMEVFVFGGQSFLRVGDNITPFDPKEKGGIDSEAFTAAWETAAEVAREFPGADLGDLGKEQLKRVTAAYMNALQAGGRKSVGDDFQTDLEKFWEQTKNVAGSGGAGNGSSATKPNAEPQAQAPVVSSVSTPRSQVSAQQPAATQQTSSNTGGRYTAGGAAERYMANGAAEPYNAGGAGSPANYGQNVQNSQQNQQPYNFFTPPSGILDALPPLNVSRISVSPSTPEALRVGEMARVTARDDPDYSFRSDTSSSPPISTSVPAPDEESSGGDIDVGKIATYGIPALGVLYKTAPRAAKLISNVYSSVKNFPRKNAVARVLVKAFPGLVSGTKGVGLKSLGWIGLALAVNEGVGDMVTSIINSGKGLNDKDKRKYDTGASAYLAELIAKVSTDPKNIQKIKSNILDDIDGLSKQKTKAAGDQIRFLLKLTSNLDEVGLRALNSTNYDQRLASYANTTLSSPIYAQQPGYVRPQLSGFIR